ncbi:endonuclease/exonuclease/phosphatase (EEP) superfamily protein YafD [Sphingopyxis sp. OAS728]|uniref:endonuclease/exonuclease/phosphatase family protein n=1 Tax=Sphingopyxis sp. OAS728 TaxID=2663823 RepID=UPI00178A6C22|nr:endonuclease/exonuclease/phosphatase family protein [Sphingopyxis sp. OAS728]MBE1527229.1 endonuclease/exonuclease/phosphatase (EEP) superfamily protein YafD [Sphingopyxis sp. OAS728]
MKLARTFGILLTGGACVAAWLSLAGAFVPALDAFASFLPLFGVATVLGLLLARRLGWTLVVALLGLTPVALRMVPELTREIPTAQGGAPQIRLLTHNVWGRNADPADTAQAIIDAKPDVVTLQEVDGSFRPMLAALNQHFAYATKCPPGCDLAIVSRWPIADSDYFLKDAEGRKFGPAMLWARVVGPGEQPFTVVTLHYPRPTSRDQAVRRRDVVQALARIERGPLIVAGDMNLTPWAAAMRGQDRALAPLTRMTRALPSWPRAFPVLPIDQLYAGPDWGLVSARRLPATGSDHVPVLVTLARR